jgi:rhodanese-related sulfurtransferase
MIGPIRIEPHAARARLDAGEAVALDVTSALVWPAVNHRIPGSVRVVPEPVMRALDAARPAPQVLAYFDALPADRDVIAYCTCPNEETSSRIAHFLRNHGRQAWALRGGLAAWRTAGYPMDAKATAPARVPSVDEDCPDCDQEVGSHRS